MLAFGLKGLDKEDLHNILQEPVLLDVTDAPSIHFRAIGIKYMEQAMEELDDEPLSLPLLQALILNTHCLLVQRVRGKAWRYLGTCIRTAYELNLHLIDAGKQSHEPITNVEKWCVEEEWRRAWWAIWEMDVFASVIRRCPSGIDWAQNETFLPAEDARWYGGQPQQSCFLDVNVTTRWKSLAATKNRSPSAWFILLNSLMKDAQTISSPTSIDKPLLSFPERSLEASGGIIDEHQRLLLQKKGAATKRLSTISNALYCTVIVLPEEFQYQGQQLNFGGMDLQRPGAIAKRLTHSFIYSIYLMTQLTKLMILKYHVFRSGMKWTLHRNHKTIDTRSAECDDPSGSPSPSTATEPPYLSQYFEAADNVVSIIRSSAGDHYKHVNPFLASTTWLAGAVQLLHRSDLAEGDPVRELMTSNFELVSLIYQKTVSFWNMSPVPLRNWETLEKGLESVKSNPHGGDKFHYETPCIFTAGNRGRLSESKRNLYTAGASNTASDHDNVNEISRCTTNNAEMGDGMTETSASVYGGVAFSQVSQPQNQHQQHDPVRSTSQHQYDTSPPLLGQPTHHEQNFCIDMTSSDADVVTGTERPPAFPSTYGQAAALSPIFMDGLPFAVDRDVNLDFSSYLDEMFSGSYLP